MWYPSTPDSGVRPMKRSNNFMLICVESYSATVEATGATVLVAPYTVDDGRNSFCSAAVLDAGKWTEVTRKAKTRRPGRPPTMQGSTERSQETSHVKE
jgi:hypothetical protein